MVAIPRKNWTPSKYSAVCSLHFTETDIERESSSSSFVEMSRAYSECSTIHFPQYLSDCVVDDSIKIYVSGYGSKLLKN